MNRIAAAIPLILAVTTLVACGPAVPAGRSTGADGASTTAPPSRTLSIIMRVEPPEMLGGAIDRSFVQKVVFAGPLGVWDPQGLPTPVLAEAAPQLNTETWRVFPDGRMETTFRLRQGLTWHDGTSLTADDVAFTLRAMRARVEWGIASGSNELKQIEDIQAIDPRTAVIKWREPYVEAPAPEFVPYPRHLLEAALDRGDAEAFENLPYWTTGYVGAGPYRVERWEPGAFIEGAAFSGFALGQPRINRVRLTWNNDPNVTLTRLVAGDADIALDGSLRFEQASVLRDQWSGGGTVLLSPTSLRYIQVQARRDYVSPRALLDVRVRRALLHAIDRPTLAEAMIEDRTMVADTVPPPTVAYHPMLDRTVTKYPFDPRRTDQLLAEAGFTKGPDGFYTSPTEGRLALEVRGVSSGSEERDTTIVAGQLREAGVDTTMLLLPSSARAVDDKAKGTFPGLTLNNNSLNGRDLGMDKWLTSKIGSPENEWIGTNRLGWSNPEYDRLYGLFTTTLDTRQATDYMVHMMKLLSDELPHLPLYYNFQVVAHSTALLGPRAPSPESTRFANIAEWTLR